MLHIRKSGDRGHANFGWLDSYHTFSFGQYHDPDFMGFGPLRVINDDKIAGGGGFPMHPHDNMEIVTYMVSGALAHKDSLGSGSTIRPGDLQRMSAGTGIRHSEYNPSATETAHLLQIWLLPQARGVAPSYEEKRFDPETRKGQLRLVGAQDGRDGAVTIGQDVDLFASVLASGDKVSHSFREGRLGWLQVARGQVTANGHALETGDAMALADIETLEISGRGDEAEILLFDMVR